MRLQRRRGRTATPSRARVDDAPSTQVAHRLACPVAMDVELPAGPGRTGPTDTVRVPMAGVRGTVVGPSVHCPADRPGRRDHVPPDAARSEAAIREAPSACGMHA